MKTETSVPSKILIHGKSGKMSSAVFAECSRRFGVDKAEQFSLRNLSPRDAKDFVAKIPSDTVVVDFTDERMLLPFLRLADGKSFSLVCGTSGLSSAHFKYLKRRHSHSATLYAPNFSLGALLVREQIKLAAKFTQGLAGWSGAILDFHHDAKKDCPSATAQLWANTWSQHSSDRDAEISSIRLGDGISEHTFYLAGQGERVEIQHKLLARSALISGILAAVEFVSRSEPGYYGTEDLLRKIMG